MWMSDDDTASTRSNKRTKGTNQIMIIIITDQSIEKAIKLLKITLRENGRLYSSSVKLQQEITRTCLSGELRSFEVIA